MLETYMASVVLETSPINLFQMPLDEFVCILEERTGKDLRILLEFCLSLSWCECLVVFLNLKWCCFSIRIKTFLLNLYKLYKFAKLYKVQICRLL